MVTVTAAQCADMAGAHQPRQLPPRAQHRVVPRAEAHEGPAERLRAAARVRLAGHVS